METEHGFVASRRQYLAIIEEWNIAKNVKPHEMRVAVRKVLERWVSEGKDTGIEVRGVSITRDKLKRFLKREELKLSKPPTDGPEDPSNTPVVQRQLRDSREIFRSKQKRMKISTTDGGTRVSLDISDQDVQVSVDLSKDLVDRWRIATPDVGYRVYTPVPATRGLHTPSLYKSSIVKSIQTVVKADTAPQPLDLAITTSASVKPVPQILINRGKAPTGYLLLCKAVGDQLMWSTVEQFLVDSCQSALLTQSELILAHSRIGAITLMVDLRTGPHDHVFLYHSDRELHFPIVDTCGHCKDAVASYNLDPGSSMGHSFLNILQTMKGFGDSEFRVQRAPGARRRDLETQMLVPVEPHVRFEPSDLVTPGLSKDLYVIPEIDTSTPTTPPEDPDSESPPDFDYEEFMTWIDQNQF
ncbi:hypothetical protein TWF694_008074 [Orbilia ellipsospora]|uniref:Clr5 domain-containing protein n=1 Tax=Orbilia ellipsospora TaxID=2528407 RepID=A0AAV9XGI0_9PEZI